jgi:CHASE3 domain sensor protein
MRLRRRVQLLLAVFLALVIVTIGVDVALLGLRADKANELADTLRPAQLELDALLTSLVDQETGQRGYLLTGDDSFLEPYTTGAARTAEALERLRMLLADRDDLLAGVQRIRSRVSAWQDLAADFEIQRRRDEGLEVVTALVTGGTGRELFDRARDEVDAVSRDLAAEADRANDELDELDARLVLVDIGVLGLVAVLVLSAGVVARLWFARPLEQLTTSVRQVASGALQTTVTVQGPPEFVELGGDVEAMRRRILQEVEEAQRAREALADRGMIVLTLRDELAAPVAPALPPGVRLASRFAPAQGIVAGDWLDVVSLGSSRLALALVDVSGHGAGVGAFALRTKALTVAAAQSHDPGAALEWVADRLGDTGEQFLTGVVVQLDAETGIVRYASAGHPPMLLGGLTGITELGPTGPLLGPIGGTWATAEVDLGRGGVLVAYSDGLIEARDADGEPFGQERLASIVERTQLDGPDAVADACLAAVQRHQATREDDLTLCVLSR